MGNKQFDFPGRIFADGHTFYRTIAGTGIKFPAETEAL